MKIAVTTAGADLSAPVELRFGRATAFLVYDTDTGNVSRIENTQQLNAAQGAGIQAAQTVINNGAQALISGHCGPKAFQVLKMGKVEIFLSDGGTVGEALRSLEAGNLKKADDADVEGHWV